MKLADPSWSVVGVESGKSFAWLYHYENAEAEARFQARQQGEAMIIRPFVVADYFSSVVA